MDVPGSLSSSTWSREPFATVSDPVILHVLFTPAGHVTDETREDCRVSHKQRDWSVVGAIIYFTLLYITLHMSSAVICDKPFSALRIVIGNNIQGNETAPIVRIQRSRSAAFGIIAWRLINAIMIPLVQFVIGFLSWEACQDRLIYRANILYRCGPTVVNNKLCAVWHYIYVSRVQLVGGRVSESWRHVFSCNADPLFRQRPSMLSGVQNFTRSWKKTHQILFCEHHQAIRSTKGKVPNLSHTFVGPMCETRIQDISTRRGRTAD